MQVLSSQSSTVTSPYMLVLWRAQRLMVVMHDIHFLLGYGVGHCVDYVFSS